MSSDSARETLRRRLTEENKILRAQLAEAIEALRPWAEVDVFGGQLYEDEIRRSAEVYKELKEEAKE